MIAFDALTRLETMLLDVQGLAEALMIIGLSDDGREVQEALCFLARQLQREHRIGREAFDEVFEAMKARS